MYENYSFLTNEKIKSDNNKTKLLCSKYNYFDLHDISIFFFITLSFFIQYFSHILVSSSLLIISFLLTSLFIIYIGVSSRSIFHDLKIIKIDMLWLLALMVIIFSHTMTQLESSNYINSLISLFSFFLGVSLLIFSEKNSSSFRLSNKAIIFFSLFYALSVWIQILSPSIYEHFLMLLSENNALEIFEWARAGKYYTGFSSNPAFTAGHIVSGIIMLVSNRKIIRSTKQYITSSTLTIFLLLTLLMTGKRAHILFLLISLFLLYFLPFKGEKLAKRVLHMIIIGIIAIIIIIMTFDVLRSIPVISRTIKTILDLLAGKDVSSGRTKLYHHAWSLFKENPIMGIGWGNFKKTTLTMGLFEKEMEVHNIYLQLLCETGIVGFISLLIPILTFLKLTLSSLRIEVQNSKKRSWLSLLYYSMGYQMFFLLYGLTGNVLYDSNFLLMYFYCCTITSAYLLNGNINYNKNKV